MSWLMVANACSCRIYEFDQHPQRLTLVKEMNHPENRLKKSDYLTSDRPGHYHADPSIRGAYSPHSDPKEIEVSNFAREIAEVLNQGRNMHCYDELILVSPPHMKGLLTKHINKHVKDLIVKEIAKDIVQLPEHELLTFLQKTL